MTDQHCLTSAIAPLSALITGLLRSPRSWGHHDQVPYTLYVLNVGIPHVMPTDNQ
jgi:hypothetical protein